MDFNLINLIWAVVVVPIGWLYVSYNNRGKRISDLEAEVKNLKDKIEPVSSDIKELTSVINNAQLSIEKRFFDLAVDQMKRKG